MEEERWKKENGNEDLTLSLSWKEREIDGEMFYYLFCKKTEFLQLQWEKGIRKSC